MGQFETEIGASGSYYMCYTYLLCIEGKEGNSLYSSMGASIKYVEKQWGRGHPNVNDTTKAYVVNLSMKVVWVRSPQNPVNIVYECPLLYFTTGICK